MASDPQPPAPSSPGLVKNLAYGLVVVIVLAGLAVRGWRLAGSIFGFGDDAMLSQLSTESDEAWAKAIEHSTAGDAEYNALIEVVNSDGWESLRQDHATDKAVEELKATAETFRLAAKKLEEAMKREVAEKLKEFLKLKHDLYLAYADAYDHKLEAVELMADATIATKDELIAKLNSLTEMSDVSFAAANEMGVKADAIAKELEAK